MEPLEFKRIFLRNISHTIEKLTRKGFGHLRLSAVTTSVKRINSEITKYDSPFPPVSFQRLFREIAVRFEFSWSLENEVHNPGMKYSVDLGALRWDLSKFNELVLLKQSYEQGCDDESLWKDKIPLMQFVNGDFIAVSDASSNETERVYYLTPNDVDNSIIEFNHELLEFLLLWAKLGCVSDFDLLQFRDDDSGQLDLKGDCAVAWLEWLKSDS